MLLSVSVRAGQAVLPLCTRINSIHYENDAGLHFSATDGSPRRATVPAHSGAEQQFTPEFPVSQVNGTTEVTSWPAYPIKPSCRRLVATS
jgi:hypothetical protein